MKRRLLAVLVSILLLCSMLPLGAVSVSADAGWKDWAQADSRWGSIRLGTYGDNMANIGCAVTAVAKIIVQSGCMSSDECNPGILVNWLNANGGLGSGGDIVWAAPAEMVDNFTYQGIASFNWVSPANCESQILDFLRQGFHLVLQVPGWGGGAHFIAVETERSLKEKKVYIMDSLSGMVNSGITLASRYSQVGVYVLYKGEGNGGNSTSGLVSEQFNSHCDIKVISDKTYIKSLPCSEDSDPDSVNVEIAKKGDEYEAIKLCKNKWGKLWYQVKAKNGETGYMYAGHTAFVGQRSDDVWVEKMNVPKSLEEGASFSIGGTVGATYSSIGRVQMWVSGYTDGVDYLYGHEWTDVSAYHLSGSAVDNMLNFGALKTGKYLITLRVGVTTYYAIDGETVDTKIQEGRSLYGATFTVVNASCDHDYHATTMRPTCTEGGYSIYTCTFCGYEYIDDYTDPRGHNYCVTPVRPTCTEGGYTIYTCGNCVYEYIDDYTDPLGHDDIVYTYAPTCETEGYIERWCQRCGRSDTGDYVDAFGHDYVITTVNPTCTQQGYSEYWCQRCSGFYIDNYIDAIGHSYDNDYDDTCNACGAVRETLTLPPAVSQIDGVVEVQMWVTVPEWAIEWALDVYDGFLVNNHTVVTKADLMSEKHLQELVQILNDQGGLNYTVSQLKRNLSIRVFCGGEYINAAVIDDKNGITVLSLSESADSCTPLVLRDSIRVSLGETVYALGKKNFVKSGVVEDWSFLTLGMSDGSLIESVQCIVSDALRIQGYHGGPLVDVNGYAVGIKFSGNAGTAIGSRKIMEVLDLLGISYTNDHEHSYDNDCDTTCNTCGEHREVADHNYVLESFTDATCDFYGVSTYVCSGCGIYYSETIPAKGHIEVTVNGYAATCTENGITDGIECLICHTVLTAQQVIPAKGHNYDDEYDAECNVCGFIRDAMQRGDADGDGRVNNRDLGCLQQYLNERPVTINVHAVDMDGNGRLNNRDLGLFQRYLNSL